ncbi:MAG: GNAT family N-acetyltransferase [Chitinophagaceae bacterium]
MNLQTEYLITTDKSQMNPDDIHHWLAKESHWAKGMPRELFQTAFDNSFAVGAMKDGRQIGYAKLVTDYATFAYLGDVYVLQSHRGRGLAHIMMEELMSQPWVKDIRRLMLSTKDAHSIYAKFGFSPLRFPDRIMEILRHHSYENPDYTP